MVVPQKYNHNIFKIRHYKFLQSKASGINSTFYLTKLILIKLYKSIYFLKKMKSLSLLDELVEFGTLTAPVQPTLPKE